MSGILVRFCLECEHYHGRIIKGCTRPGCECVCGPSPSVAARLKKDAYLLESLEAAWDQGWHEHYLEWERQQQDPSHPITKVNPYRSTRG